MVGLKTLSGYYPPPLTQDVLCNRVMGGGEGGRLRDFKEGFNSLFRWRASRHGDKTRRKTVAFAAFLAFSFFEAIHLAHGGWVGGDFSVDTPSPSVAHLARFPAFLPSGGLSALRPSSADALAVCQAARRHVDGGLCPEIKQYAVTRGEGGHGGRGWAAREVTMTANIKPTKTNTATSAAGPS